MMVWERRQESRRAVEAGLLIGVGTTIKTVPLLLLLPFLFSTRSGRERALLVATALGVVATACLPFLLAEPKASRRVRSRLWCAQPRGRADRSPLAASHLRSDPSLALVGSFPGAAGWLSDHGGPITFVVLLTLAGFLWRYRPATVDGIVTLWLAIFAFSPNFLLQYMVWALPFFIMAGYLRVTALLQLVVIPALLVTYVNPGALPDGAATVYVVINVPPLGVFGSRHC